MGDVGGPDGHKDHLSRRTFLTRSAAAGGAVALGAVAGSALAGCGSGSGASSSTTLPPSSGKGGVNTGIRSVADP